MRQAYDVVVPIPSRERGKTYWHRIGRAYDNNRGITLYLDSLPIGNKIMLFPAKRDEGPVTNVPDLPDLGAPPDDGAPPPTDADVPSETPAEDEIPF